MYRFKRSFFLVCSALALTPLCFAGQCLSPLQQFGDTSYENAQVLDSSYSIMSTESSMFVLNTDQGRIDRFSRDWQPQGPLTPPTQGALSAPQSMLLHANGDFYVVDTGNNRVVRLASDGSFLGAFGSLGTGDGEFRQPMDIAADDQGNLYVVDTGNARIQVFSEDGTWIRSWGSRGSSSGRFLNPLGIDVDPNMGMIYVLDSGVRPAVKIFSPNGAFYGAWDLELHDIYSDLAFDAHGNLYIGGSNLYAFTPKGKLLCDQIVFGSIRALDINSEGELFLFVAVAHSKFFDPESAHREWTQHEILQMETLPAPPPPPPSAVDGSALTLHLQGGRNYCGGAPGIPRDIVTSGIADGSDYTVYVLADNSQVTSVAGLEFGIEYSSGLEIEDWSNCATLAFRDPHWPDNGSGNILTWDAINDCQKNSLVVAGYFHVRATESATMSLATYPYSQTVEVTNCYFQNIPVTHENLGWIALNAPGESPGALQEGCNALLGPCPDPEELPPPGWTFSAPTPNPFTGLASIQYSLPRDTQVSIRVIDAQGRVVSVLRDRWQPAGDYGITWDGTDDQGARVAGGVYFMSMRTPEGVRQTREVVLVP